MISNATKSEKEQVLSLWKTCYPTQDVNYLRYYFNEIYDQGICVVNKKDQKIISSLQMNYHALHLMGKTITCSHFLGAATLVDYRRKGYFDELMTTLLDEAGHNCLISLVRAFNPKVFTRYGFEVIYERKSYTIPKKMLENTNTKQVSQIADSIELLTIYQKFTSRFDGFYIRDLHYYDLLNKELALGNKKLYVYRDGNYIVQGYVIVQMKRHEVVVQEAVYMNSTILKNLLKEAMMDYKEITVMVSVKEHLEKIFPLVIAKKHAFIMARINNVALFNKLYNTEITNAKEAFALVDKPLWNHEYY